MKFREKLFTFLDHDGVPWNNNNAEHAVKHFAKYRMISNGRMTAKGLEPYLILLSVHQTCEYKKVSFLKFLLSEGKDVDAFVVSCRRQPGQPNPAGTKAPAPQAVEVPTSPDRPSPELGDQTNSVAP